MGRRGQDRNVPMLHLFCKHQILKLVPRDVVKVVNVEDGAAKEVRVWEHWVADHHAHAALPGGHDLLEYREIE